MPLAVCFSAPTRTYSSSLVFQLLLLLQTQTRVDMRQLVMMLGTSHFCVSLPGDLYCTSGNDKQQNASCCGVN